MKRVLVILLIGFSMLSLLCVGAALALTFTPARAQVARAVENTLERAMNRLGIETGPRTQVILPKPGAQQVSPETEQEGILVAGVLAGSPAESAGLQRGDILLAVNDQPVNSLIDLRGALQDTQPGDEISLSVQRGAETLTLNATLESDAQQPRGFGHWSGLLGIVPCECSLSQLPDTFMFEQIEPGATIGEVLADSPAEAAGLQVGDVILAVDGESVQLPAMLSALLADYEPGDTITLTVAGEEGEQREVRVTLGENPNSEAPNRAWLGVRTRFERVWPGFPQDQQPDWSFPDGNQFPMMPPEMVFPTLPEGYSSGAILREVLDDSAAAQAGLQAGQVILAVDGVKIDSQDALAEQIANHQPDDQVTLTVTGGEDGAAQEVAVSLGENPEKAGASYLGVRYGFIRVERSDQRAPDELPSGPES